MVFSKQEAISFSVTTLGWMGAIVSCVLPIWRVTFPDDETDTDVSVWEGLWHICQAQANRWIQCTLYDTRLQAAQDIKVSQVFMVICTIGTWLGLLLCVLGDRRFECFMNRNIESTVMKVAGGVFLSVGLLVLVPLSWVTHNVIHGFFNPLLGYSKKVQMGTSLYLAWTSSVLLLLGGILLCVNIPACRDFPSSIKIPGVRLSRANNNTSDA
ncbi:claudin-13-like [Mus pahari]|uniref:claudin-13-like n=1 Tax=Mus pahari TaxID=10093 RepID=UPI000A30B76B|nr:claudin-13-like [Mus pahari]